MFVISDLHLGHENILIFTHNDRPLRPFSSLTEMHVQIIERWNKVVTAKDKVYVLGDVAFTREGLHLMAMLNGRKRLVMGNHDLYKAKEYLKYFDELYGVRQIDRIWMTHMPMHGDSVSQKRVLLNVHGHLHANIIDHPKYVNVSVEQIDFTPLHWDELKKRIPK